MSKLLNANDIAEQALRKIRAFAINDGGANANELDQALLWLDLNMAEVAGHERCWWLVPLSITLDLTSGTSHYALANILAESAPDGFAFPVDAFLVRNSRDLKLERIPRWAYDEKENKTTAGTPTEIYFDRQRDTEIDLYPVPNETGLQLKITFQAFPPTVSANAENDHGLRIAWQRWAIYKVASDIGDGTVRMLPQSDLSVLEGKANAAFGKLMAIDNRERHSRPHRVAPWGV